ncbi:pyrroloquinoline quinone biosynthesis peptide chaperone PqqD [Streptomyces sp. NBC_00212]|uniref:pyrroloquinoline quinone biosynthesis peptide chaperone PqqD n=1 Tax=Streptomyces sp. NBC_00212 TaxID=2975684 RepID=UPI0038639FBE
MRGVTKVVREVGDVREMRDVRDVREAHRASAMGAESALGVHAVDASSRVVPAETADESALTSPSAPHPQATPGAATATPPTLDPLTSNPLALDPLTSDPLALGPAWRPTLSRHVLLRRDRVRGVDLLVLPERVVVLHGPAGSIVRLCDGEREVREIVHDLAARHPEAPVAAEVPLFLGRLREEGWLR